jgi:hypothetical protein
MRTDCRRRAARQAERDRGALRRLAMHEASHALINYAYNVGIEQIRVGRGVRTDSLDQLDGVCFWRTKTGEGIDPSVLV